LDRLLPKAALKDWLEWASARYHLLGPVESEDGSQAFAPLSQDRLPVLDNRRSCLPPKEAVLPSCETLFTFDPGDGEPRLLPAGGEFAPTLMLGMKPCDVRSLEVLDRVFLDGRFQDPYYAARRGSLVTVAYVCESKRWSCFCSSVGDPVEWSLAADVALTDVGDGYLASANTSAGEELLGCPAFREPSGDDLARRDVVWNALREAAEPFDPEAVAAAVDWEEPAWDAVAEKCIGCGVCSFLCPTCTCFDIQDETIGGGRVERFRVRDTCQFCDFTKMGHGHNPRPSRRERVRQRISHKFKYIVRQCGICGCVGCGRCVELCPVNADLRGVLSEILKENGCESISA
jgi:ferredoxin